MKKLSSNFLFYKGLAGYIIGPPIIILWVRFFMNNNVPSFLPYSVYILLLLSLIWQGYIDS